jgi:hypothetical protein
VGKITSIFPAFAQLGKIVRREQDFFDKLNQELSGTCLKVPVCLPWDNPPLPL